MTMPVCSVCGSPLSDANAVVGFCPVCVGKKQDAIGRVTCGECRWWQAGLTDKPGRCRAHPPVITAGAYHCTLWPETYGDAWCGEAVRK
jgi:predicted amidophosphoribosyltransferase